MKVLIIGSNSIHVSSYVKSLAEKESDIFLLTEENCSFDHVKGEFMVNFRDLNPISLIKNYFKLKKYLLFLQPDVIHVHQLNRLAYFVTRIASKLKIPVVSTAWGSDVLLIPFKNRFFRFLTKKAIERSVTVTADAEIMIESMQLLVKSDVKYELLQYGIEMVDPVEKEDVIFSNRLHKDLYRIDKVIDYFCEFSKLNSSWKLVIGAEGEKTEMLKDKVNTLNISDKVEFVGWLLPADNKSWYAKSKIYISIPESDGTSVSVLEAMSAGCIPILSDIGVSYELIEKGENGIIEKKNENPLDRAILLNSEEVYLRNRALVELKASRNRCTDRFIEIYSNAIRHEN